MSIDPTGYTLAHEHLHIDLSGFKNNVDCRLDQYAFICQEMNDLMTRGVRNVIEMTNRYMGRNAQFMLDVMLAMTAFTLMTRRGICEMQNVAPDGKGIRLELIGFRGNETIPDTLH